MIRQSFACGFENELELKGVGNKYEGVNVAQPKIQPLGLGNVKYDGTIRYGFEFTSPVLTSKEFTKKNEAFAKWKKLFKKFKELKVYSDNNVAMHVHVSRKDLSKTDIQKLNYFVFRNPEFCSIIGERQPTKYCRLAENDETVLSINADVNKHDHRYDAEVASPANHKHRMLNVARPYTIEFRFFKAADNIFTFIKNMQFVVALVNFVKETKLDMDSFRCGGTRILGATGEMCEGGDDNIVPVFCEYVKKNKREYFYLFNFLVRHRFLKK